MSDVNKETQSQSPLDSTGSHKDADRASIGLQDVSGLAAEPSEVASILDKNAKIRRVCFLVWAIVGSLVLAGVAIYLLKILAIPVSIIIWTVVFVFCLRGIVNGLEKHGVNRGIGTTVSYIVMFLALALVGVLMFSPVFGLNNQFANIISSIPSYIDTIRGWIDDIYKNYGHWLDDDSVKSFVNSIGESMSSWASSMA